MDAQRQALWAAMGMDLWQLKRGELLACQGQLQVGGDHRAEAPLPGLWWSGALPAWLGDLLKVLALPVEACHPLTQAEGESALNMVLLLPGASEQAMSVACQHRFDARQGKRALWQQLCEAGVVTGSQLEGV